MKIQNYQEKYKLKEVSIDRLHLGVNNYSVATKLQNMFSFQKGNNYYQHKYSSNGFTVYINPRITNIPKVKLIINTKYFKGILSDNVKRILELTQGWYIQAMDLAYDFNTKISNSFVLTRSNAKKNKKYDPNTYYFSKNSDSRSLLYDKKKQLKEKRNLTIPDKYLTRYEIRMRLSKGRKRLIDRDFSYIRKFIDKHNFISEYSKLPLSTEEKKIIRDSKDRKNENLIGTNHTVSKIRSTVKEHSVPFYSIFELQWQEMLGHIIDAIDNQEKKLSA